MQMTQKIYQLQSNCIFKMFKHSRHPFPSTFLCTPTWAGCSVSLLHGFRSGFPFGTFSTLDSPNVGFVGLLLCGDGAHTPVPSEIRVRDT